MSKSKNPAEERRAIEEKITNIKTAIRQDTNHLNELIQKKTNKERNIRTRRLIERGAMLDLIFCGNALRKTTPSLGKK